MGLWRLAAVVVFLSVGSAGAFEMRAGSWEYDYPTSSYGVPVPDGQVIALRGGAGFSFHGKVLDYWIDTGRCPCVPGMLWLNWYTGTSSGRDHKGEGAAGIVTFRGVTYRVGPGTGNRLQFYVYGPVTAGIGKRMKLPPLGMDGQHRTKQMTMILNGSFEHGGRFEQISGSVVATVDLEQEGDEWDVESVSYDVRAR